MQRREIPPLRKPTPSPFGGLRTGRSEGEEKSVGLLRSCLRQAGGMTGWELEVRSWSLKLEIRRNEERDSTERRTRFDGAKNEIRRSEERDSTERRTRFQNGQGRVLKA
jgi:hypothetical protein